MNGDGARPFELVVVSGKGGTGKTTFSACMSAAAFESGLDAVVVDCDVDAPDLHILLHPEKHSTIPFTGGGRAAVRQAACTGCGRCMELCRFGAVERREGRYSIAAGRCEGCMVCVDHCPAGAIETVDHVCGHIYESSTRFGPMLHALLKPGEENSGKLAAELRRMARRHPRPLILVDGPPGIGCPVISSLTGADFAVIVAEPTSSGVHDAERLATLLEQLSLKGGLVINKADLAPQQCERLENLAETHPSLELLGTLPFSRTVLECLEDAGIPTEARPDDAFSKAFGRIWKNLLEMMTEA